MYLITGSNSNLAVTKIATMRATVVFLIVALATVALAKYHPLSDEYIAEINRKQSSWKAGRNFDVDEWETFKRKSSGARINLAKLRNVQSIVHDEDQTIPEFYDFRQVYPECDSIREIYDQAQCGSCWSFCAVEVMSDRICIKSEQKKKVAVSAQDGMECCANCGDCNGGDPYGLYEYWAENGISTGGHYNRTDEGCKPYFLPECGSNCPNEVAAVPACQRKCTSSELDYEKELTFGLTDLYMFRNDTQIQLEMLKNGPVSTVFLVPADFGNYKSGVYQMTTDVIVGSHCLKIVGWGNDNGLKYWIIANSWGKAWGEDGFFRIIRGRNESGIEGAAMSASPKLDLNFNQN